MVDHSLIKMYMVSGKYRKTLYSSNGSRYQYYRPAKHINVFESFWCISVVWVLSLIKPAIAKRKNNKNLEHLWWFQLRLNFLLRLFRIFSSTAVGIRPRKESKRGFLDFFILFTTVRNDQEKRGLKVLIKSLFEGSIHVSSLSLGL